jgi:hypothetical protein
MSIAALAFVAACGGSRNEMANDSTSQASQSGNVPGLARSKPVSRVARLDAGTALNLRAVNGLTSRRDHDGARITATTAVATRDGNDVVIPVGAEFVGHVVRIRPAETPKAHGVMELAFDSVRFGGQTYPVATRVTSVATERVGRGVTTGDAGKVGAGAVIGGVAGRVIGGNATGTAVGAAAGAAGGAVYANQTRDIDLRLPSGGAIGITLTEPFTRTVVTRE